ncbi:MAG: EF-hand domain-containing protein [Geminicoccaceae bacterium]
MRRHPPRRLLPWAATAALAALAAGPAWAQSDPVDEITGPDYSIEEIAFIAADTDGDGVITEAEMARDAARGFATLDKDGSGTLTPEELGPHDPALFERVDTDGDGVLSFDEVMANKLRALKAGDTDGDGGLSFDEMVTIVEKETGGAS